MKKVVIRLKNQNHPSGKRLRAGLIITTRPQFYSITEEQQNVLLKDGELEIVNRGRLFEEGLKEKGKYIIENGEISLKAKEENEKTYEEYEIMTKNDIIDELINSGFIEGTDFKKTMNKEELINLLLKKFIS